MYRHADHHRRLLTAFPTLLLVAAAFASPASSSTRSRVYYIGIDHVSWDYYPVSSNPPGGNAKTDLCTGHPLADDQLLFVGDLGLVLDDGFVPSSIYNKTVFRQYTDATFTAIKQRSEEEKHLALLGPLIRVAAGETLVVVVRGLPISAAGGRSDTSFVFEIDGLSKEGRPALIAPGQIVTHRYHVQPQSTAIGKSFVDSHMLLYRATVGMGPDGNAGIYRGLLGAAITYKKGHLRADGTPRNIDTELVSILWVANENTGDESGDVEESNLMHTINGRLYCSLPGLDITVGKRTVWYFGAVGNEVDVHTAHMHGVVGLSTGGEHTDSIRLLPATTSALEIFPDNPGTWLMHCHINDHLHAGMQALFTVHGDTPSETGAPVPAKERVYYVQAEDVLWDYAPKGTNVCDGTPFGDDELIFTQSHFPFDLGDGVEGFGVGSQYIKSRYLLYTDASFTTPVVRERSMEHLGLMGPILRARIDETIVIHFRNNASESLSLHPHGVLYSKANEGAPYNDGSSEEDKKDDQIVPGGSYTYRWEVPRRAGPGPGERQDTKLWMYHSHRSEITDTYAGLFGPIIIIGPTGKFDDDSLLPSDGTREVFLHMSVMNEGGSFHLEENALRDEGNRNLTQEQFDSLLESDGFAESNLMHSINGYLYCNGPLLKLRQDRATRFYFYALGTEVDLHTPVVGNEVLRLNVKSSRGSGALLPGTFSSALVRPRHAGIHEIRCNVNDHVVAGMRMLYKVGSQGKEEKAVGRVDVTHYIAAEEINWDYAPKGRDGCPRREFGEDEDVFTKAGDFTPGSRYVKAVYREYQDSTFSSLKNSGRSFSGVTGPLLHFEVGEVVRIVFRNRLSFAANINIVGLELVDSTSSSREIAPGAENVYLYHVRYESGPSGGDGSAAPYVYYSSVDSIAHTAAGLTGGIGVVKRGNLDKTTRLPVGVAVAYPLQLNIFRENESPLIMESLKRFALSPESISDEIIEALNEDDDWLESNAMHSINGYLYGNNPKLRLSQDSRVRFYVFGFGSEASMHSPVFKGQIISRTVRRGSNQHGVQILPFNAEAVDVIFASKGLWPIVCGVADHVLGGMKVCVKVE